MRRPATMKGPTGRGPFALTVRRCLRTATLPTIVATFVSLGLAYLDQRGLDHNIDAPGALSPWLTLPLFVVAVVCSGTAVIFWPLFADRSVGADWMVRLQGGSGPGCGAVIAAALSAQAALSLPLVLLLPRALGAPATATVLFRLAPPVDAVLDAQQPQLRFVAPAEPCIELQLRPLASLPAGPVRRSRVAVSGDGVPLTTAEVSFVQTGQLVRVPFAATSFRQLELELLEGTVPLFFPDGAVTLLSAVGKSSLGNGLCLALLALVPTFVALAIGCLSGAVAAMPTVLTVVMCLLFVQVIGGLGPLAEALLMVMRGQWLPSSTVLPACLPSVALAAVALLLAMLLRRRRHGSSA